MKNKFDYYYIKSALNSEICDKIIDMGKKRIEDYKKIGLSTVANTNGDLSKQAVKKLNKDAVSQADLTLEEIKKAKKESYVRDSTVAWLNDQWIYDKVYPFIREANRKAGWNYEFSISESFQFTVYKPGQFYGWHMDGNGDHFGKYKRYVPGITHKGYSETLPQGYTEDTKMLNKVRKISLTINLNKPGEYEGGNLKFDFGPHSTRDRFHECVEIRPQGSIIVFPSYTYHQVTPVTKGTRYSLVLWTLGEPFK